MSMVYGTVIVSSGYRVMV